MSILDLRAAVLASIVFGAASAEAGRSMAGAEIERAFRGITLDGVYQDGSFFSETYFDDGSISYRDAEGIDSGDWSVENDLFCTFYVAQQGACFFVVREGVNCFTFFESERGFDGSIPRETWTSRGWNRHEEATCVKPPEAVL